MSLTTIRYFLFFLACSCATAVAQPLAAEALFCGSAERMAFAPVAGFGVVAEWAGPQYPTEPSPWTARLETTRPLLPVLMK